MANERQSVVRVTVTRDDGSRFIFNESTKLDQTDTTPNVDDRIISVGTAESDLAFQNIAGPGGVICLQNVGANNIEWGPKNGSNVMEDCCEIHPGEIQKFRLKPAGVTLRWKALTAATEVRLWTVDA